MKRNHGYIILWGKWDGIAFFDRATGGAGSFFALLRLRSSRRSCRALAGDQILLVTSSGEAVFIEDKDPFSVLTSGRMVLARIRSDTNFSELIVMRVTENSFYVLYIIKEKSPVPDTWKGYRSRV